MCGGDLGRWDREKTAARFYTRPSVWSATRSRGTQSSSSISDYLIFPVVMGPPGIRNRFDYLLILARQASASQKVRVYHPFRMGMESTHRAHDRPLTSHNSSDIAVRAERSSRDRTRDQEPCFTCRGVWSDDLCSAQTFRFSISELRGESHPLAPKAPSPLCLPIRWNVPFLNFVPLYLSHQVPPWTVCDIRNWVGKTPRVVLAPHRQLIICTDR